MAYFAGLDVSVKETSVCIVDDAGRIVREADIARRDGYVALCQDRTHAVQQNFPSLWCESPPDCSVSGGQPTPAQTCRLCVIGDQFERTSVVVCQPVSRRT